LLAGGDGALNKQVQPQQSKKPVLVTLTLVAFFIGFNRIPSLVSGAANTLSAKPLKWGGGFCISQAVLNVLGE
jgi:hypothetical protein